MERLHQSVTLDACVQMTTLPGEGYIHRPIRRHLVVAHITIGKILQRFSVSQYHRRRRGQDRWPATTWTENRFAPEVDLEKIYHIPPPPNGAGRTALHPNQDTVWHHLANTAIHYTLRLEALHCHHHIVQLSSNFDVPTSIGSCTIVQISSSRTCRFYRFISECTSESS